MATALANYSSPLPLRVSQTRCGATVASPSWNDTRRCNAKRVCMPQKAGLHPRVSSCCMHPSRRKRNKAASEDDSMRDLLEVAAAHIRPFRRTSSSCVDCCPQNRGSFMCNETWVFPRAVSNAVRQLGAFTMLSCELRMHLLETTIRSISTV